MRRLGLIASILVYFSTCLVWILFDNYQIGNQWVFTIDLAIYNWIIALDGISLFFLYLTSLITPLCILFQWNSVKSTSLVSFLISLELLLFLIFTSMDIMIFYIFFEIILIPFFMYIGLSGYRKRRIHAAFLFFFYTLVGSILMLTAIILLYLKTGTTDFYVLYYLGDSLSNSTMHFIWICFFIALAVKLPMYPLHIWLPEAHVEAPTVGSVLLASILLKLGFYGFFRFLFLPFSEITFYYSPIVLLCATLGVIFASLATLRQIDIKKIIAYSSVAHMNMALLGMFLFNYYSIIGSFLMLLGHGFISSGLFFLVGVLYDRYKTKIFFYYKGLVHTMPLFVTFMFLYVLGNISFPGTANFLSELLIFVGICMTWSFWAILGSSVAIFAGTVYNMWLFNKISFGLPNYKYIQNTIDLNIKELITLSILFVHIIWFSIYPKYYIDFFIDGLHFSVYSLI